VVIEINKDPEAKPDPLVDWTTPYLDCPIRETLLADKTEARRLARRTKSFVVIEEELYKKSHRESCNVASPPSRGRSC
jgi:hypothetical protein